MIDDARRLADRMVLSADAGQIDAMIAAELADLEASGDFAARAVGRLYARGYRRAQCEWREAETGEAIVLALPLLITQELCETALSAGLTDDDARKIVGGILSEVLAGLPRALETGLAARRIRKGGDG
jgi:hypothetical protein